MARSPAEIQVDIAVTRRLVERHLDGIARALPRGPWVPYASLAGALVLGILLSRVPLLRLVGAGARTVQTGLTVARAVALVDRYLTDRSRPLAA